MLKEISPLTSFAIAMAMVVLMPRLAERLKLPAIVGFILTGFILGPGWLGVIRQEGEVITLFAELGKLLFMFFVGFEIDLDDFRKARNRALFFGFLTFLLPLTFGVLLGRLTGAGWNSSLLIGSIIASHTLLAFPVIQRLGLASHPAILMVVGGTIFTDIASMLVLALTVGVHLSGFSWPFLGRELLQLAIYVPLVLFLAGTIARKAIIRYGQTPEVRVMIMLVVIAVCAEGAAFIQLEGIVGAFLAGIAVKRALRGKFAVEQLEVVAKALFIPAFFLTTGFLLDLAVLKRTFLSDPWVTLGLLAAIFAGKFLAAWWVGATYQQKTAERMTVASLSLPQMAATLASAVVGFQCINANGERLLNAGFVNAVVVVVIVTCVVGSILTERFAPRMEAIPVVETPPADESPTLT